MTPDEFIVSFGHYVDARAATLLIGAGLSQPSGYPTWPELLEIPLAELGIDPIEDLPQLAQYYVDTFGRARLEQHVAETFAAIADAEPTPAHRLLTQLPIDEYWTTNWDPLVERSFGDAHVFADDSQFAADSVAPGTRRINKMHGSIDPPGPIVITRDDYDRYPETHPRFWQLLRAQFLTRTFLFLGFGFTDPNLDLVFRLVRLYTADIQREHFAILKRPEDAGDPVARARDLKLFDLKAGELQRVGVKVVLVDTYGEITEILGRLVARCRPPQLMISGSAPPGADRTSAAGSYPTAPLPDDVAHIAAAIGGRLASTTVAVVGAGEVGALAGYQLMRTLALNGTYAPDRVTLVRRQRDRSLDAPNLRLGQLVFTGEDPTDLRSVALSDVRALLVLAGADGAQAEITSAIQFGLGIVPVGCTGGTARAHWELMRQDLNAHPLGGRPLDPDLFERLVSTDPDEAADAAVQLVIQALYLA